MVNRLVAIFGEDWASTGFEEAQEALRKNASAPAAKVAAKATRALVRQMPPLRSALKTAIKRAVARAGKDVMVHAEVKAPVKDAAKAAVKEAVKGNGQRKTSILAKYRKIPELPRRHRSLRTIAFGPSRATRNVLKS